MQLVLMIFISKHIFTHKFVGPHCRLDMRGGLQPGSPNSESFEVDIAAPNAVPRAPLATGNLTFGVPPLEEFVGQFGRVEFGNRN